MELFNILRILLGSASSFSSGGPGKGMHNWANKKIVQQHYFIHECEAISSHFSDSGLFGLSFTGSSHNSKDILLQMINIFNEFKNGVNEVDLQRAKNMIKRQVLLNLGNQGDRLEEVAKTVSIIFFNYILYCIYFITSIV